MEIAIMNDVIRKIDVVNGEWDVYLELSLKRNNDTLEIEIFDTDYIKQLLELLERTALSKVKMFLSVCLEKLDMKQRMQLSVRWKFWPLMTS